MNVRGREARLVRKLVPRGSMISFASAFEADGRTWLVTPELAIVPADRVRLYRSSSFAGVSLGDALSLPIAWIRKSPRPKFHRASDGRIVPTGESWDVRTAVGLTGGSITQSDHVFLATVEPGTFIAESDATVVEKSQELPSGVEPRRQVDPDQHHEGNAHRLRGRSPGLHDTDLAGTRWLAARGQRREPRAGEASQHAARRLPHPVQGSLQRDVAGSGAEEILHLRCPLHPIFPWAVRTPRRVLARRLR